MVMSVNKWTVCKTGVIFVLARSTWSCQSINGLFVRLVSCLFWQGVHGHVNKWTVCKTGVMFVLARCAWSCQ